MPKRVKSFKTDELNRMMDKLKINPSIYTIRDHDYYIGTQKELLKKNQDMTLCAGDWLVYDYHGINKNTPQWCLFAINRTFTIIDSEMKFIRNSKSDTNYGFLSKSSLENILNNYKSSIDSDENVDLAQGIDLFQVNGVVTRGCYKTNYKIYMCTIQQQVYAFLMIPDGYYQ